MLFMLHGYKIYLHDFHCLKTTYFKKEKTSKSLCFYRKMQVDFFSQMEL